MIYIGAESPTPVVILPSGTPLFIHHLCGALLSNLVKFFGVLWENAAAVIHW